MQKGKILIAGGTGLIGTVVKREAEMRGYKVTLLSRSPGPGKIAWNPSNRTIQTEQPLVFDAIINLAGSSIAAGRWTAKRKQDILKSRTESTGTLEHHLKSGLLKTEMYIGASGVGIFGSRGNEPVDEQTGIPETNDWLIQTTRQWEDAHQQIRDLGIRTVITRIGLVLSKDGGALKEVLMPANFGLLTYFGNGQQYWPWIHIQDVAGIFLRAVEDESCRGIYIATAPFPLTNLEFIKEINRHFSVKRIILPVPEWALSVILGKMHQVVFDSCNARPDRLLKSKFEFRFEHLNSALKDILGK